MARNIEIKARVHNRERLISLIESLAHSKPVEIRQDDNFFFCTHGRLKLREFAPDHGELIYYERSDTTGPKESTYEISSTSEPEKLRKILSFALGTKGSVRKKRLLYLAGITRIHVDDVENLGNFVELEVVLDDAKTVADGYRIAADLMARLDIREEDLVAEAYIDMMSVDKA